MEILIFSLFSLPDSLWGIMGTNHMWCLQGTLRGPDRWPRRALHVDVERNRLRKTQDTGTLAAPEAPNLQIFMDGQG